MHIRMLLVAAATWIAILSSIVIAQESHAPKGIENEEALPGRHLYVGSCPERS